jgi:hypothetical protein
VGNRNRKASKDELARIRGVIGEVFPELRAIFGVHGD